MALKLSLIKSGDNGANPK